MSRGRGIPAAAQGAAGPWVKGSVRGLSPLDKHRLEISGEEDYSGLLY